MQSISCFEKHNKLLHRSVTFDNRYPLLEVHQVELLYNLNVVELVEQAQQVAGGLIRLGDT